MLFRLSIIETSAAFEDFAYLVWIEVSHLFALFLGQIDDRFVSGLPEHHKPASNGVHR